MIDYAQEAISHFDSKYVVVGHQSEKVSSTIFETFIPVVQKEQLGTGHAISTLLESSEFESDNSQYLVVIPGDVPLIRKDELDKLVNDVIENKAAIGLISAKLKTVWVWKNLKNNEEFEKIIEESDANETEKQINEINRNILHRYKFPKFKYWEFRKFK